MIWQRQFTNQDGSLEELFPVCVLWVYIITCNVLPGFYLTFLSMARRQASFLYSRRNCRRHIHLLAFSCVSINGAQVSKEKTFTKALLYLKLTMVLK